MDNNDKLRDLRKIKAERDKGQWTEAECQRLTVALREGEQAYQQARRDVQADRIATSGDDDAGDENRQIK